MAKNIIWKEHFILEISPTDKTVYDQSFNWPCFENKKNLKMLLNALSLVAFA